MQRWRSRVGQVFHLIEQPIDGICSGGPRPVSATCFIASKRSRRAFGIGVVREASILPRYCNSSCALKPKKSGVSAVRARHVLRLVDYVGEGESMLGRKRLRRSFRRSSQTAANSTRTGPQRRHRDR